MITYNYFKTLDQRPLILKHLQEYNLKFTGVRPMEDRYFYVFKDDRLIGSIHAYLSWDWITLCNIFYEDVEILELLLSKICSYFKGRTSGISYQGDDMDRLNDFYKVGFKNEGIIQKTPKSKEEHITSHTDLSIISNLELNVHETSDINSIIDKELKEKLCFEKEKQKIDLIFLAKDNNKFVGGVHGEIKEDRLYISLLVVIDKYKGQKVGTKLMDLIEEKAKSMGVVCSDLGTCDFQAKPFYEKRGYKVISTLPNYPQGFNEYNLLKKI